MNVRPVVVDLRPRPKSPGKRVRDKKAKRDLLLKAQGNICAHCEKPFPFTWAPNDPDMPTLEHVEPRTTGGRASLDNLLLKHKRCNEYCGARPPSGRDRKWQAIVQRYLAVAKEAAA